MITWTARIKERAREHILTPSYTLLDGEDKDEKFFIDFWGLEEPDVEWYELRKNKIEI